MPVHTQIIIMLVAGSIAFCLALGVAGSLMQRRAAAIPAVPLFPGSSFPGSFAIFYTVFFIITFSMGIIAAETQPPAEGQQAEDVPGMLASMAMQIALYLPFMAIYFSLPNRELPAVPLGRKIRWVMGGLLALTLPNILLECCGLTNFLVEITGCPPNQQVVDTMANGSPAVKSVMVFMAVIVAPITEECCFRGFIYNILKQRSGPVLAAVASGILFSAIHASIAQFIPLVIFGVVQCYMYEKARSLWLPILLHVLFNACSSVVILSM